MNNHVLIPTNLNDTTDTLTKNAKIVFVYGCLTQCDSWGILPNQPNLMAYKIGLSEQEVADAVKELDKVGLLVLFNRNTLLAVMDFVLWNHFKFLKTNKKRCQYEKEVLIAIKEGKLYEGWIELPTISMNKKESFLKDRLQVQVKEEVQVESKHSNTKKVVSTSNSTCTTTSDSDLTSSSDSMGKSIPNDWKDVPDTWQTTEQEVGLTKDEVDDVFSAEK
tara:strand:+ start:182 stop:841 length:660 start_codon:yes stop_codon:yes gene_type:complete